MRELRCSSLTMPVKGEKRWHGKLHDEVRSGVGGGSRASLRWRPPSRGRREADYQQSQRITESIIQVADVSISAKQGVPMMGLVPRQSRSRVSIRSLRNPAAGQRSRANPMGIIADLRSNCNRTSARNNYSTRNALPLGEAGDRRHRSRHWRAYDPNKHNIRHRQAIRLRRACGSWGISDAYLTAKNQKYPSSPRRTNSALA